ncbi:MAG: acyl-ACP desaturase [Zoogloea oleivorans]|jgi:hypothetical protein|uniref:Ferritin-like domain-containing protein n=1 Tax=Zoogloea oleivorans TaxID=1552750 RepID=A0A6C2CPD5_9RHOO|nr:acyl-ACP desaturase [Zoogloea oleivorans]MBT9495863.1 acyl-ACP desaturase [Zoogloea sp.]MDY0037558.1 acyl-ACP desaturase [Zoogloea oleivorans]TYC55322.1 hypothetical protein ETQ85_15030 [Zoogloea oleivorans]
MSGLETVVKFSYLSDENRWDANRYNFDWLPELDEHDREIIRLLDCLRDGEFSGQASAAQFHDLMIQAKAAGYTDDLVADWSPLFSYMNVIVYEEMRHGLAIGLIHQYVTQGNTSFIADMNVREFGKRYIWCYEERRYWDLYSYILSHLFSEVINTELYRDVVTRIHHPGLKEVLANVRNDEARHIAAWTALVKDLLNADPEHKVRALASLQCGLTHHNAMVHETYFEGLNKMLPLFISEPKNKLGPIKRISKQKYRILLELFGEDNPYSESDVQQIHLQYLGKAAGHTRARYSETSPGNIEFVS